MNPLATRFSPRMEVQPLALQNLQANNASGVASRAGSFAYFGSGTGTSPLPIYLAYMNGSRDAGNPAAYTNAANTWDRPHSSLR